MEGKGRLTYGSERARGKSGRQQVVVIGRWTSSIGIDDLGTRLKANLNSVESDDE